MTINNYVMSIGILNTLNKHSASMATHMQHIATGLRIARVADDPAGWAIGQRMDVRICSLDAASRNAQQSKSLLKVADGGISSTVDILRTLKEKAIEAANDTATTADRQTIQKLFDQYADQIDDNALVTYNGKYLLDGSRQGLSQKTQQAFTNEQLGKDMKLTTKLTDLTRRDGSSLNILAGDTVNISYVKDGKTKRVHRKVFPSYVLVEMILDDQSWYVVRHTPGVTGFVGAGNHPIPLSEREIQDIIGKVGKEQVKPKIEIDVKPGDVVRVKSGPFQGQVGPVAEVMADKGKVKFTVTVFGRETLVEADYQELEKL